MLSAKGNGGGSGIKGAELTANIEDLTLKNKLALYSETPVPFNSDTLLTFTTKSTNSYFRLYVYGNNKALFVWRNTNNNSLMARTYNTKTKAFISEDVSIGSNVEANSQIGIFKNANNEFFATCGTGASVGLYVFSFKIENDIPVPLTATALTGTGWYGYYVEAIRHDANTLIIWHWGADSNTYRRISAVDITSANNVHIITYTEITNSVCSDYDNVFKYSSHTSDIVVFTKLSNSMYLLTHTPDSGAIYLGALPFTFDGSTLTFGKYTKANTGYSYSSGLNSTLRFRYKIVLRKNDNTVFIRHMNNNNATYASYCAIDEYTVSMNGLVANNANIPENVKTSTVLDNYVYNEGNASVDPYSKMFVYLNGVLSVLTIPKLSGLITGTFYSTYMSAGAQRLSDQIYELWGIYPRTTSGSSPFSFYFDICQAYLREISNAVFTEGAGKPCYVKNVDDDNNLCTIIVNE